MAALVALVAALTAEFSYNTGVDLASAANARDDMRAHFLARSGMNLSRIVIKVQHDVLDRYRQYLGDLQLADYLPMMIGAFGGGKDEVEALTSLVGIDPSVGVKGLGLAAGEFDVKVSTDDGKINVNCANGSPATQKQLEAMLGALITPNRFDSLFENRDGDGQFTDRPTFARAIIDYVDRDTAAYGQNGQPEDYGYEGWKDPYRAKDNYLDSIDELRLVRGMDDRRWAAFGSAFTVYGGCKVNVGAANDLGVIAAVIVDAVKNPADPVLTDPMKLWSLAQVIAQARALGVMFDNIQAFADFVKDPGAIFGGLVDKAAGGPSPFPQVEGVELDMAKLNLVARAGGRRTYRVEATAKIGRVEKKIVGLWDADTQNQHARDPAYARGAWVHWREE